MEFNLQNILSKESYLKLSNYVDNGEDGICKLGFNKPQSPYDIVATLQAMADPEYVNVRKNWGSEVSKMPFEAKGDFPKYIAGMNNSFALKVRGFQTGFLRFPLVNNYMTENSYLKNVDFDNYEKSKQIFEDKLNINIFETNHDFSMIEYKENIFRKSGNLLRKILSPVIFAKNKIAIFSVEKEEVSKVKLTNGKVGNANLYVSKIFNGKTLTQAEKLVAVIDYFSKKLCVKSVKKYAKQLGMSRNKDLSKIVYASQLLTDIFVSLAFDMSKENNKQIDNSLRLQLANVLVGLQDNAEAVKFISKIAYFSTNAILYNLGLSKSNIIATRNRLGITYLKTPENLYDIMFGATQNSHFINENGSIFYQGESPLFEKVQNSFSKIEKTSNLTPTNDFEEEPVEEMEFSASKQTAPTSNEIEQTAKFNQSENTEMETQEETETKPIIDEIENNSVIYENAVEDEDRIPDEDLFEENFINYPVEKEEITEETETKPIENEIEGMQKVESEEIVKTENGKQAEIENVNSKKEIEISDLGNSKQNENLYSNFLEEGEQFVDNRENKKPKTEQSGLGEFVNLDKEQTEIDDFNKEISALNQDIGCVNDFQISKRKKIRTIRKCLANKTRLEVKKPIKKLTQNDYTNVYEESYVPKKENQIELEKFVKLDANQKKITKFNKTTSKPKISTAKRHISVKKKVETNPVRQQLEADFEKIFEKEKPARTAPKKIEQKKKTNEPVSKKTPAKTKKPTIKTATGKTANAINITNNYILNVNNYNLPKQFENN